MEAETTEIIRDTINVETSGEHNSSPENELYTSREDFLLSLSQCGKCRESLHGKYPKFLQCLHTFCLQCISMLDNEGGLVKCPICSISTIPGDIIDNMFLPSMSLISNELSQEEEIKLCTGCEESVPAMFYCVECSEWICDTCMQAHKRVKMTKDHTIETRDEAIGRNEDRQDSRRPSALLCPSHPMEPLKLYCNSCARLTCRDCQLVEHKDHKYQFIQEAASAYKDFLRSLVSKMREKRTYVANARGLVERRNKEINEKEKIVMDEVKVFAMSLIADINQKCRQLVNDLQSICQAKRRQLLQKESEICQLSTSLDRGLHFAEHVLSLCEDVGLLYSRKTLSYQLRNILQMRCEVPNPHHVVDLRFSGNQGIAPVMAKLGYIVVDGIPFNKKTSQINLSPGLTSTNLIPPGAGAHSTPTFTAHHTGIRPPPVSNYHGNPLINLPISMPTQMPVDQKQAWLTSLRRNLERQQQQQQQQQMIQNYEKHGMFNSPVQNLISMPDNEPNRCVPLSHTLPHFSPLGLQASHPPNQSANISSTIMSSSRYLRRPATPITTYNYPSKYTVCPSTYSSTAPHSYNQSPMLYPSNVLSREPQGSSKVHHGSITLNQLQEERNKREHMMQPQMQPIIIVPTDLDHNLPSPTDLTHKNARSNRSSSVMDLTKSPARDESNSRAKSCANEGRNITDSTRSSQPFTLPYKPIEERIRTPTPCIESTTHETISNGNDLTSPSGVGDLFLSEWTNFEASDSIMDQEMDSSQRQSSSNNLESESSRKHPTSSSINSQKISKDLENFDSSLQHKIGSTSNIYFKSQVSMDSDNVAGSQINSVTVDKEENQKLSNSNETSDDCLNQTILPPEPNYQDFQETISNKSELGIITSLNDCISKSEDESINQQNLEMDVKKSTDINETGGVDILECDVFSSLQKACNELQYSNISEHGEEFLNVDEDNKIDKTSDVEIEVSIKNNEPLCKENVSDNSNAELSVTDNNVIALQTNLIEDKFPLEDILHSANDSIDSIDGMGELEKGEENIILENPLEDMPSLFEDFELNNTEIESTKEMERHQDSSQRTRSSGDPSDDYCAVCNNGGELLCCDGCPKVFHIQCHVSQLSSAPSDKWFCGLCKPDASLTLKEADQPIILKGKRHFKVDLTEKEREICERLLLELFCDYTSTPFHEPVSKLVPNYHKMITHPMDLGTVRSKLTKNHFDRYQKIEDFLRDVLLVFSNCATFNQPESSIYRAGKTLNEKFRKRTNQLLPYINLSTIEHRTSAETRSKRRRTATSILSQGRANYSGGEGDDSQDSMSSIPPLSHE